MVCPKCKSENVTTQIVQDIKIKDKHHGIFYWLFVSWWWIPIKWFVFTLPALLIAIFGKKKQKVVTKNKTMCVCQNCGNTWQA